MFKLRKKIGVFIFLAAVFHPFYALPFSIPETLQYELKWEGIPAGTATLDILNDGGRVKIISTAKSAKWISIFYEVDDKIESTIEKDFSPLHYRVKIKEGRHRRNKEIIFDRQKEKAMYIDHIKSEKEEFDIPHEVFDSMSGFYRMRTLKLEVGKPVHITVFDSKKVWDVEVLVLRKERIETPAGTFDTIVVKPLMKSEGIFARKGDVLIWLTDDEKKIPVKLNSKVSLGSVTAVLVRGRY